MTELEILELARAEGFSAAFIAPEEIPLNPGFRRFCEENRCGKFNANYSCPPDCGTPEEMRQNILKEEKCIVFTSHWDINDFTDWAGIETAKKGHNAAALRFMAKLRKVGFEGFAAGYSGCPLCDPCKRLLKEPCAFPDKRISCMSAYCIDVALLARKCGLEFAWNPCKLFLFGMAAFHTSKTKKINRHQLYLSTIASDASAIAQEHGLGLEIAQFCTATNIDRHFPETDQQVRRMIRPGRNVIYHAPFNELFPCAIDPLARKLAEYRYRQAIALAKAYGATKVVIHSGYHPWIYFEEWYVEQSIAFWKNFMQEDHGIQVVLENVLEPEMSWSIDIVKGVANPNFQLCLDVGHVHTYSKYSVMEWLENLAPYISHFHIHNNDKSWDTHSGLDQGTIPMKDLLLRAQDLCPEATYTLEVMEPGPAIRWLSENDLI